MSLAERFVCDHGYWEGEDCKQCPLVKEIARLTASLAAAVSVVEAARFITDFAGDIGACAVCGAGIGKSDESDGPQCDCPAIGVRRAMRNYDAATVGRADK